MTGTGPLPLGDEAVAQLHELIRKVYLITSLGDPSVSDDRSLDLLCDAMPLDAALIARFSPTGLELEDYRIRGLPDSFVRAYQRTREQNTLLKQALAILPGYSEPLLLPASEKTARSSLFDRRVLSHYGIDDQLNFAYRDVVTGTLYVLHVYRYTNSPKFTDSESWLTCHCLPHLATAHGQAVILDAAFAADSVIHKPTALCDARGKFFFAQDDCVRLLKEQFPKWKGEDLPVDLPATAETAQVIRGDLVIDITPHCDLSIVRVWRKSAHDRLSRREQQIASLVSDQLTTKAIAKHLGVAPSTVGNHMQNIFKKLGISSRAELGALMD